MRKKKPPIILISLVIVLLGFVVVMNWQSIWNPPSDEDSPAPEQQVTSTQPGAGRTTQSAEDLAKSQGAIVGSSTGPTKLTAPTVHKAPLEGDILKVHKFTQPKQTPRDTGTMGQWYTPNSVAQTPNKIKYIAEPE
jgi:hypothetical protein